MAKDIYDFKEDILVETSSVAKELASVAKEYSIKISQLDFDIQSIKTFELDHETADANWVELDGGLLKRLDDTKHYGAETLEVKQNYSIRIYLKDTYDDPFKDVTTHLTAKDNFTKIYFTIEKGSMFHYRETLLRDLINFINKKKVINGVFIEFREKGFRREIESFLEKKIPVLEDDLVLIVSQAVKATEAVDDKLEFIYKEAFEKQKKENKKVDHSQKGFMITVAKDALLIKYTKPKKGILGKDCKGKILRVTFPTAENIPSFKIAESVNKVEDDFKIEFFALKDGNVTFKDDTYSIESTVEVGGLSFKGTGSINAGTDNDIEINVKESDASKDAVGMGVKVTVATLNIDGNVGEKAEITAQEVEIRGQTHQTSKITADKVKVAIHKGKIYGKEVHVSRLESGIIEGETVFVEDAIGGVIRGRDIKIQNLHSHLKIFSSKKIEIENILGSENLIVIDLEGYKDGVSEIDETRDLFTETSQRIEFLQRNLKETLDKVLEVRKAFTLATKRLIQFETNEIEPPASLTKTLNGHQEFLENYKSMKEELREKKDSILTIESKLRELESAIFDAEIRVNSPWKDYDKIEFRLVNPKKSIEKIQHEGDKEASFKIEKVMYEDEQYEIVTQTLDEIEKVD